MNKMRFWKTIILLALAALVLISGLLRKKDDSKLDIVNINTPNYKSDYSDTLIYTPEGLLNYHLIAQHVEYFSDEGVAWFTQPIMTTFNADNMPTWSIRSDRAKLINNRILYLYGHVEVNALTANTQVRKVIASNAKINMVTQDITSQDFVKLYGITFNSSGLKMRGNLRNKNAELIKKVRTCYEIQTKKTQS